MTPDQFLAELERQNPAPVCLFLGPETYMRDRCRRALIERALAPEEREDGFVRHDLESVSLVRAIDDARSLSLFTPRRLIWLAGAEAALPRARGAPETEEAATGKDGVEAGQAALAGYVKDPTPGVVVVIDAPRFDFEGEDKSRIERVRKYYAAIPQRVEFARLPGAAVRRLAARLAQETGLEIGPAELSLLVEAAGEDAARVSLEIEKLRMYKGAGVPVLAEDVARLVPSARAANIFELVAALGRNDRRRALDLLDTLVREGEYLPLALTFLSTQFRQALVAREQGLRGPGQVQSHFARWGVPMWPSRAEQISQTLTQYSGARLAEAIGRVAAADRDLRDTRPDDRIILEEFLVRLTRPRSAGLQPATDRQTEACPTSIPGSST